MPRSTAFAAHVLAASSHAGQLVMAIAGTMLAAGLAAQSLHQCSGRDSIGRFGGGPAPLATVAAPRRIPRMRGSKSFGGEAPERAIGPGAAIASGGL